MPSFDSLTPLGQRMLREIPPWLRDDPDVKAVLHSMAKSKEAIRAAAQQIRDDLIPIRASSRGLGWWELYYGLPVEPEGLSEEARRGIVLGHIAREPPISSGASWQEQVTALIGGGWEYEEHTTTAKVTIKVPFPPSSDMFLLAENRIPLLPSWPCHLEPEVVSMEGFVLDLSLLDKEPFEAP
jgi:uncharacterized protein YmfQ (DUF2313 family)